MEDTWYEVARDTPQVDEPGTGNVSDPTIDPFAGQQTSTVFLSDEWVFSVCSRCSNYSTWRGSQLVFPAATASAGPPHEMMPPDARELYVEASQVVGISRRAGTALARAALERLIKTVDPIDTRMDLATRIDRLRPKVSESLGKMLTVIRHVGNKSLHVEDTDDEVMTLVLDPNDVEIVELIFISINDLTDELIARPARAQEIFEKLPASVRERVGKSN
jgi:hypothetical protein